jgi:hypothetical protein
VSSSNLRVTGLLGCILLFSASSLKASLYSEMCSASFNASRPLRCTTQYLFCHLKILAFTPSSAKPSTHLLASSSSWPPCALEEHLLSQSIPYQPEDAPAKACVYWVPLRGHYLQHRFFTFSSSPAAILGPSLLRELLLPSPRYRVRNPSKLLLGIFSRQLFALRAWPLLHPIARLPMLPQALPASRACKGRRSHPIRL